MLISQVYTSVNFYPRSPCGERRVGPWPCGPARIISIHALLAESDQEYIIRNVEALIFLSTLSLRRATSGISAILTNLDDFYPRSPCGERPYSGTNCSGANTYFYPRSPCGERLSSISLSYNAENFYPRSPCGERRGLYSRKACAILFLSTLSLRRATLCPPAVAAVAVTISIHALLAESDRCVLRIVSVCSEFLSTLSLRRATLGGILIPRKLKFLSTLSLRRATAQLENTEEYKGFLSTLSLRRATLIILRQKKMVLYFYPRSPCGERQLGSPRTGCPVLISIHALLAESDPRFAGRAQRNPHFYPRSPCGERRIACMHLQAYNNFYPRSPCGERPSSLIKAARFADFYPRSPCGERRLIDVVHGFSS